MPAAPKDQTAPATAMAGMPGGALSSRLTGSFSFNRALLSPLAGSATPTPALDAVTGGTVQVQLSTAAVQVGEQEEQPSLAGLPGTAGKSHLEDSFCSPGNRLASLNTD